MEILKFYMVFLTSISSYCASILAETTSNDPEPLNIISLAKSVSPAIGPTGHRLHLGIPPPPPPPPPYCNENEVMSYCYNDNCLKRYCVQEEPKPNCEMLDYCLPGCLCKEGYLRAQNGTCVPEDQCHATENNTKDHDSTVSEDFSSRKKRSPNQTSITQFIPMQRPRPTPYINHSISCGENEIVSTCYNNYCIRRYCDEAIPETCVFQDECQTDCICKDGYLRAHNGTCIPLDPCLNPEPCGENELFTNCVNSGCGRRNCSEIGRSPVCRDIAPNGCEAGCECKPGYLRAANGKCVRIDKCPQNEICTKPHEYFDPYTPLCPIRDCSAFYSTALAACSSRLGEPSSNPTCRCEEGFYRNYNQDCVPFEDCAKYCIGTNEILVAYPESCEPETCDSIKNLKEQSSNKTCGTTECLCAPGYVRNKHGECIKKENCEISHEFSDSEENAKNS